MPSKAVQISIDEELLNRIDKDPEALVKGRSAFIRAAVELYLRARKRKKIEEELVHAYEGQADAMIDEVAELMEHQEWPTE